MLEKYRLNDGSIYWHKLYFAMVPIWMTKYAPPFGDYNYAAYLYQPHRYAIDLYYQAKWFVQRGYRGYSDSDVWDLNSYLCSWMPMALTALRKNRMGHPAHLTNKRWGVILDRMINSFVIARKIQNQEYKTPQESGRALKRFHKGFNLVNKYFFNLWD